MIIKMKLKIQQLMNNLLHSHSAPTPPRKVSPLDSIIVNEKAEKFDIIKYTFDRQSEGTADIYKEIRDAISTTIEK